MLCEPKPVLPRGFRRMSIDEPLFLRFSDQHFRLDFTGDSSGIHPSLMLCWWFLWSLFWPQKGITIGMLNAYAGLSENVKTLVDAKLISIADKDAVRLCFIIRLSFSTAFPPQCDSHSPCPLSFLLHSIGRKHYASLRSTRPKEWSRRWHGLHQADWVSSWGRYVFA